MRSDRTTRRVAATGQARRLVDLLLALLPEPSGMRTILTFVLALGGMCLGEHRGLRKVA